MKEKKARVEDALHACRAAVEEGILPGGGVAVLRARKALDKPSQGHVGDEKLGVDIVRRAVAAPIKQIAANCGLDGSVVANNVESKSDANYGFNALTQTYGDLIKDGVIVPTKVEMIWIIEVQWNPDETFRELLQPVVPVNGGTVERLSRRFLFPSYEFVRIM